ncbi:MAG: hypothetical protein ACOC0U_07145 [Desulfovibrionales bacterium]
MTCARDGEALPFAFMKNAKICERFSWEEQLFLVEHQGREYLVRRRGECFPSSCGAACCSFFCLKGPWTRYLAGFAYQGRAAMYIRQKCRFLGGDYLCKRWRKPDYPENCLSFPVPGDLMYAEVMDRCSYWFTLERRIKREDRPDRLTA